MPVHHIANRQSHSSPVALQCTLCLVFADLFAASPELPSADPTEVAGGSKPDGTDQQLCERGRPGLSSISIWVALLVSQHCCWRLGSGVPIPFAAKSPCRHTAVPCSCGCTQCRILCRVQCSSEHNLLAVKTGVCPRQLCWAFSPVQRTIPGALHTGHAWDAASRMHEIQLQQSGWLMWCCVDGWAHLG